MPVITRDQDPRQLHKRNAPSSSISTTSTPAAAPSGTYRANSEDLAAPADASARGQCRCPFHRDDHAGARRSPAGGAGAGGLTGMQRVDGEILCARRGAGARRLHAFDHETTARSRTWPRRPGSCSGSSSSRDARPRLPSAPDRPRQGRRALGPVALTLDSADHRPAP